MKFLNKKPADRQTECHKTNNFAPAPKTGTRQLQESKTVTEIATLHFTNAHLETNVKKRLNSPV